MPFVAQVGQLTPPQTLARATKPPCALRRSGNDDEAHDARHEAGAAGVISVTSNLVPGLMRRLMDARDPQLQADLKALMGGWVWNSTLCPKP